MAHSLARAELLTFLDHELRYSFEKAPYAEKIERAALPTDDRQSTTGFLGTEWFNFRLLDKQGALYIPTPGMSAQIQLAKFCAGLFDKASLSLLSGKLIDPSYIGGEHKTPANDYHEAIDYTVKAASSWRHFYAPEAIGSTALPRAEELMGADFDQTPFAGEDIGIPRLQVAITISNTAENTSEKSYARRYTRAYTLALQLGLRAMDIYETFAINKLTPEQYAIPLTIRR